MNNTAVFSHRPAAGVSVGAYSDGTTLFVTVALVNDGTSKKGIFHEDRRDQFSHKEARSIIRERLSDMVFSGKQIAEGVVFVTSMSSREFMNQFRERFKPTPDESDEVLSSSDEFGDVGVRYRLTADEIFNRVMNMANEVVADASARV